MSARVKLVHRDPREAERRAAQLERLGYEVDRAPLDGPAALRVLASDPPAVVVLDLSRAPATGRDLALALRARRGLRALPIVAVAAEDGARAQLQALLPDVRAASWRGIGRALREALAAPPAPPPRAASVLAGYSGTPLPRKLGLPESGVVVLIDAPASFEELLGPLPPGVVLRRQDRGARDLTLWFVTRRAALEQRLASVAAKVRPRKGLWIAWPKKASGIASDVSETVVRALALAAGLVDYKVCAIDATWSGLKLAVRA